MKVTTKDISASFEHLSGDERAFMEKNANIVCNIVNKAIDGLLTPQQVEEKFKSIGDKIKAEAMEESAALRKQNDELCQTVKNLAAEIEKARNRGASLAKFAKFFDRYDEMMESQKMKNFIDGVDKTSGWFDGFNVKEIGAIASAHTGADTEGLLAYPSNVVASPFAVPATSLRDVIRTVEGDPAHPNFTYLRVKKFDRNARFVTENGRLSQSNLEFEEVHTTVRRVGSYFDISKDLLLARLQIRSFLVATIPGIITQAENSAILFGDGTKSMLQGIANIPGVDSIEKQIAGAIVKGEAGSVAKVESYAGGKSCLVEFNTPISSALSSMMVTFTGATVNTDLNVPHALIKLNDRQAVVEGAQYKGEETSVASLAYTINHCSFKSVEAPNSQDVINAITACLSFAQYRPNAIALNPITVFMMETEKDSMGRPLELVRLVNGRKYIGTLPVIECPDMPVGNYLAGDFQNGANLYDYTNLELQWVEDAETVLYNMVRLAFQEQLGLVVYMPWAFAYGSLEELRKAISKDEAAKA